MSDSTDSGDLPSPSTQAPSAAEEENAPAFMICVGLGGIVGGVGALILSWMSFVSGEVPVLAIPLLTVGGLLVGLVAGAVVGLIVHPIAMLARRRPPPAAGPAYPPDDSA